MSKEEANSKKQDLQPELVLSEEIKKLNNNFKKTTMIRYRLLFGIVEGFGGVIGATIVVSIVIFVLNRLENIDFLRPLVESILNLAGKG